MLETIVGGLLNIGGGLLGDRSNQKIARQNQALTRQQMAMQRHQFDQQMDAAIQRRVADAKAAAGLFIPKSTPKWTGSVGSILQLERLAFGSYCG